MKQSFYDDYTEGMHPEILKYISEHNLDPQLTYGRDEYSKLAAERINQAFGMANADVHFLPTGTACNIIGLKFLIGIMALTHISLVTTLYPASLVMANAGFVAMLIVRRQKLSRTTK